MKAIPCRFCGRSVAIQFKAGYRPVHYRHKCPHGRDCCGGIRKHRGLNWAAQYLGDPSVLVAGCPECLQNQYSNIKDRSVFQP